MVLEPGNTWPAILLAQMQVHLDDKDLGNYRDLNYMAAKCVESPESQQIQNYIFCL